MVSPDFHGIWERQNGETDKAYSRFRDFLAMPKRNISGLARRYGIREANLRLQAVKNDWQNRAAAYDRWIHAEMERTALAGALIHAIPDPAKTNNFIDQYDAMRADLWDKRTRLLEKIDQMLDYRVGTGSKTTRKAYQLRNPQTKKWEHHVVHETVNDARWSWGDVAKLLQTVDEIGREILSLPPDVVKLMPEFSYELARHGHDTADFMRRTIEKLKAS